ncbi:MAG: hypothetical protein OQK54_08930 [Gammaproteobacteria bacterium]|nr:hypothetical protein [Gammaproteobacteria bacterium]
MKTAKFLNMSAMVVAVTAVSACTIFDPHNGVRVENNIVQQTVDPYAGFGEEGVATLDGQKAEKLLNEYRKEKASAPTERLLLDVSD